MNPGIFPFGPPEAVSMEELDRALAIHARAAFLASQAALRHLGNGGRIISIGSCFAERVPHGGVTLYAMSKSALIGFTKGLARDVAGRGITVNLACPGLHATDRLRERQVDGPVGDPADFGKVVAFLCSEPAAFVSGVALGVDGASVAGGLQEG